MAFAGNGQGERTLADEIVGTTLARAGLAIEHSATTPSSANPRASRRPPTCSSRATAALDDQSGFFFRDPLGEIE
ncbi:MAG: hypothetical protein IIC73_05065 [Armatimonadetes bacterium]|nr:hypothetical protein [Armatimonadota bacterium]